VFVCATAAAYDIPTKKTTHIEVRRRRCEAAVLRACASLEIPNILPISLEARGNPIASGESTYLTAFMGDRRDTHGVSTDDADWQKRNEDAIFRGIFINSGISKPFD
jgi:hypothetical protein